jgi:hypothetical protein
MENHKKNPYRYLPHILFLFLELATIGTYIVAFLITYLTFEEPEFAVRLLIYQKAIGWIVLSGGSTAIVFSIILAVQTSRTSEKIFDFRLWHKQIIRYFLFAFLLLLIKVFFYLNLTFRALDFFSFLYSFYLLFSISQEYSIQFNRPAWQHPTTAGLLIEGSFLLGLVISWRLFSETVASQTLGWFMLIILLFEVLTTWGRFYFLNRANPVTKRAVQMMLGSHLALFGIRFIFGIIMPTVFLLWALLISTKVPLEPVVLMIIVGEMSERILFFISSTEQNEELVKK